MDKNFHIRQIEAKLGLSINRLRLQTVFPVKLDYHLFNLVIIIYIRVYIAWLIHAMCSVKLTDLKVKLAAPRRLATAPDSALFPNGSRCSGFVKLT